MRASPPRSVILAELDAMVARAEAACERRRRAIEEPRQPMAKRSLLCADLRTMERELARLRAYRDAYRERVEARAQRSRSAASSAGRPRRTASTTDDR